MDLSQVCGRFTVRWELAGWDDKGLGVGLGSHTKRPFIRGSGEGGSEGGEGDSKKYPNTFSVGR